MSCIIKKEDLKDELKLLSSNTNITSSHLANNILEIIFTFYTKDSYKLPYLILQFTKNIEDTKPFNSKILKNEITTKIDITKFIDKFLNNFHWEEGGVTLKDYFKM